MGVLEESQSTRKTLKIVLEINDLLFYFVLSSLNITGYSWLSQSLPGKVTVPVSQDVD